MKIALVGSAPSIHIAPYEDKNWEIQQEGKPQNYPKAKWVDDEWEIWGVSPGAAGYVRRATVWFETHRWEPGSAWLSPEYVEFLKAFKGPVYTGGIIPEIPNHIVYPIERVEEVFSSYFLTSSLALMMAVAILQIEDLREKEPDHNFEDDVIAFFGVDMAAAEEYGGQRFGCQHFILEALRRDIGIYVPPESCLLRPMPVYGLCEWTHAYIKHAERSRYLNKRMNDARESIKQAEQSLATDMGSSGELGYHVNTWTSQYGLPSGVIVRNKHGTPK